MSRTQPFEPVPTGDDEAVRAGSEVPQKPGNDGGSRPLTEPHPAVGSLPRVTTAQMKQAALNVMRSASASRSGTPRAAANTPPPTGAIRPPKGTPPRDGTNQAGARRMFSRLLAAEHPPTQAFSIVDRLVGSPYSNPMVQVAGPEVDARETLEFTLGLAETMFRFGSGALEAETSMIAVTASFGLRNVDVDITNQSIYITYAGEDQVPISLLRVVRSWTSNYAGLSLVHQLVTDIVAGDVNRREAKARLEEITKRPKPFPRWFADAAGGGFAACFVLFIGGSWLGSLIAFASWLMVSQLFKVTAKWRIPEFFAVAFAALLITTTALLLWRFHVPIEPAMVVAGGIMMLLPSARFVASTQDAINGFPVTAVGRFLSAIMIFGGIIAGIMTGIVVGDMAGMETFDVTQVSAITYPTWFLIILVGLAIACGAIFEQSAPRLLLPTAGLAMLGYVLSLFVQEAGIGSRLAPAVAAVAIGGFGRLIALKMESPQMVVAVPAMMFLLPGLMIFRAMYDITVDTQDVVLGIAQLTTAFGIIISIAAGLVLGDTIARPLTKGWNSHERRRIRRR